MTTGTIASEQTSGQELPPEFLKDLLPFTDADDVGAISPTELPAGAKDVLGSAPNGGFLYIGDGLTAAQFIDYVQNYDFGRQLPTFVVLHHTSIPDTQYARARDGSWDANEQGLSDQQIYAKRKQQLDGIMSYYRGSLGWNRGPHLFIDDRWIWLFTPMYYPGIHAAEGNGTEASYSIGIEVIGHYERVRWPESIEQLVGHTVAVLKRKLGTFELRHQRFAGGVSSHRDYNKPACPGAAISEDYYLQVLRTGWERLANGEAPPTYSIKTTSTSPITAHAPLLGPATGELQQAVHFIRANLPPSSEYANDIELIMGYYWTYAPPVGIDPFLAAGQCIFETDGLRSQWAGRPRRNPAGLGVHQEGGLSFETWELAVQAHIGQLLALALRDEEANEAQRQMMQRNPRHERIGTELRGTVKKLADLSNRWMQSPDYAERLVARLRAIQGVVG